MGKRMGIAGRDIKGLFLSSIVLLALASQSCRVSEVSKRAFSFTAGRLQPGYTQVAPEIKYDAQRGYGFLESGTATSTKIFLVDLDEGNYDVTVRLGDAARETSTTIKAEARRLMLLKVETKAGEFVTRTFTVNVRKPAISTGGEVKLNTREKGPSPSCSWDGCLTLEFNGKQPGVAAVEIKPSTEAITVFLAGDSTVTDQAREPYSGWGQMLPRFFRPGVAVANHAESGLALHSFESQKRLEKILSMMKNGDYLFIQFGHNDQKDKSANAGPFTSYKANLKRFVAATRSKGATPVLVTPMERRRWKDGDPQLTLADYAEAVRQVGVEENAPLIDLHAMSRKLYAALGEEKSTKAFVFYPANTYPGQDKKLEDNTHHNTFGGYELARCMVEGIRVKVPQLATYLDENAALFDPAKPDEPEHVGIPASPISGSTEKPAGN